MARKPAPKKAGRPKSGRPVAGRTARKAAATPARDERGRFVRSPSRGRRPEQRPRDKNGRFTAPAVPSKRKPSATAPPKSRATTRGKGKAAASSKARQGRTAKITGVYLQSVTIAGTPRDIVRGKGGRFAKRPKGQAVIPRGVKGKGGKVVILTRESGTKARRVGRNALGDAFTDQARPGDALDMLASAAKERRGVFVQFGGRVFKVPASKQADLRAFVTDLKSKFFQAARKSKVGSPDLWFGVAIGDNGVLLNLDSIEMMDPELAQEFAGDREFIESARDLANYTADRFGYYLGGEVSAAAVARSWQEGLNEQADEAEEDEDQD